MRRALFGSVVLLIILVLVLSSFASAATVAVILTQSEFEALPGAESIPIPDETSLSLTPFAAYLVGYSCELGSTGISLAGGSIMVKEAVAPDYICIIGPDWNAGLGNTNPTPVSPTIVANGEDDYQVMISFADPVPGVGFKLLTNSSASETITLYFADSTQQVFTDSQLDTNANTFEFVGFKASSSITKVIINTTGGAGQNEGIAGIWVIENSPPTVDAGGPYAGNIGAPIPILGTASDPDGDSLAVTWSVNNPNCTFSNNLALDTTVTCQLIGNYTLTLTVNDGIYTVTDTAPLAITDPLLTRSSSDCTPGTYDHYKYIETKFVSSLNIPIVSSSSLDPAAKYLIEASGVFYAGGVATYDIRADAKWTQDLYQRNHNLGWTDDVHGYESSGTTLLELKVDGVFEEWGTFTDTHRYTIEKDGTGSPVTLQFQIYDTYPSNNTGGLCVALYEFENEPPVADPNGPYGPFAVNSSIQFDGSGSYDPDGDPLTYAWTFGDGGDGSGATPTHAYTSAGIYDVCLTVNDGYVDSTNVCTLAVVYDPSAGFVTGGGWINSPEGALLSDPTLTGKATFGFVAKYKKGANVPDGSTEFQFKAGNLNFHSTSYQWLVVAGDMAQFKGVGTVNGEGEYLFKIFADDDSPDTFRIIIWTNDEDHPFYDSGVQELGGGSIVVHN